MIFFFAISATIILQVYASAIQKNQFDHDRRKAMLFAQNIIEGNQDLNTIQKEYDQNFEDEGDYFRWKSLKAMKIFLITRFVFGKMNSLLVEYSLYVGEAYE